MSRILSTVALGFLRSAIVASHISARLNEQIEQAIPTAIPRFGETRIFGKVVGKSVGSVKVLS